MKCRTCYLDLDELQFHNNGEGFSPQCKKCRSDLYFSKKYGQCSQCLRHRKTYQNSLCNDCNESLGVRECRQCGLLLCVAFAFHNIRKTCIDCRRIRRRV